MAALVELRSDRATLAAERRRVEATQGPVVYMAAILGLPVELTVRWLILLMVLTCDPTAIALTVAAARRRLPALLRDFSGSRQSAQAVAHRIAMIVHAGRHLSS
jgi:hypothetical protein